MKNKTVIHSDFWLDEFDDFEDVEMDNTTRLIRLNMSRRAISNFVSILTGKSIPVLFNDGGANMTDGTTVYLSSDINSLTDFDSFVGLALHEGSHIVLSDFRLVADIWQNVPRTVYSIAETKGFSKSDVAEFTKVILNIIEDRYIDNFVYTTAPGYRGYYLALYEKYFNSPNINTMLTSDMYRTATVQSYEARLFNLMNPNTDLDCLPGLREMAERIDIANISRLKTPQDRFNVALEVCELIYNNVDSHQQALQNQNMQMSGSGGDGENIIVVVGNPSDDFGGVTTSVTPSSQEISHDKTQEANKKSGLSKNKRNAIEKALAKQRDFLSGNVKKKKVTSKEKQILEALEKAGVTLVNVGTNIDDTQRITKGVDCVVIKNFTKEFALSDNCPCVVSDANNLPLPHLVTAVNRGIQLGNLLGKRLSVRSEVNTTKYMRKSTGKIDRRVLSDLGYDNENVFYRIDTDQYKKAFIHVSIDASGSMQHRKKWDNTITCVTAICKAASMINNIRVSVSMRTTGSNGLPYIAVVYDSAKDSFNKVRTLFPYLYCNGSTPEGLCYEAIMDTLKESGEFEDCYFLNFSDGEPAYACNNLDNYISYGSENGSIHTRKQVNKIREKGYTVLSYFISEYFTGMTSKIGNNASYACFKTMYGSSSKVIDVTNIISVAKTMNQMFLDSKSKS